jgi:vacuolar-type H+-ATPase subunit D/Vma8
MKGKKTKKESLISKVRRAVKRTKKKKGEDKEDSGPSAEEISLAKKMAAIKAVQRYSKGFTGGVKVTRQGYTKK